MMKIKEWMAKSGVMFGTSGARGLVTAMTDKVCCAYTVGYLRYLQKIGEFKTGQEVAIAGDLRPSSPRILKACAAAIELMGGKVIFCGYVPTPALCNFAFAKAIPSLMITGSHIPADRNGIKFNRACGEFLKSDEIAMLEENVSLPAEWFDNTGFLSRPITLPNVTDVSAAFVKRYQDFFGEDALKGLKLGIYQHSAVGRDLLIDIVEALGGDAVPLGRSETFVPVDTEAVRKEDTDLAQQWTQSEHYNAILTTDGDSDRPLLADHQGNWLRGDILGILAAQFLQAKSVATPVSSNTALEKIGFADTVRRTKIGSPYVVSAMTEALIDGNVPSVGYEANGGFLLASNISKNGKYLPALPTRDSVLPMLCALVAARQYNDNLKDLRRTLPPRFTLSDRLAEMPTTQSKAKIEELRNAPEAEVERLGFTQTCGIIKEIDETDGFRMTFQSNEILHLRPSGNAPELRLYVEAESEQRAQELLEIGMRNIKTWR